jgi:hypothetical protein
VRCCGQPQLGTQSSMAIGMGIAAHSFSPVYNVALERSPIEMFLRFTGSGSVCGDCNSASCSCCAPKRPSCSSAWPTSARLQPAKHESNCSEPAEHVSNAASSGWAGRRGWTWPRSCTSAGQPDARLRADAPRWQGHSRSRQAPATQCGDASLGLPRSIMGTGAHWQFYLSYVAADARAQ